MLLNNTKSLSQRLKRKSKNIQGGSLEIQSSIAQSENVLRNI